MKLEAQKREVSGKKVKLLRAKEIVPASVYGPKKPSTNIQVDKKAFLKLFKTVGFNRFFDLEVEGGKTSKVLVKEIQKNPVTDRLYSVNFYQVDEDTKITVEVPVHFIGESPAVKQNLGFLITQMDSVALHCFPKDLPSELVVDIEKLENPGDAITVGDIQLAENVDLDSSMDKTTAIVYIGTAQKEEVVEEVVPAEGEATAEGAAAAPEEGTKLSVPGTKPEPAEGKHEEKKEK